MAKKEEKTAKKHEKPISLYPLKFEEALKKIAGKPPLKNEKKPNKDL